MIRFWPDRADSVLLGRMTSPHGNECSRAAAQGIERHVLATRSSNQDCHMRRTANDPNDTMVGLAGETSWFAGMLLQLATKGAYFESALRGHPPEIRGPDPVDAS